jgi:hypothetical protein
MTTDVPPRELVVDAQPAPGSSSDGGGSTMAPVLITVASAASLAKFVAPTAGLFALGAAAVYFVVNRKPNHGRFVLRVADGVVEVARERGGAPPTRIPLAELLDVTLDRETRAGGRPGETAERTRIALERREPELPVFVPDEHVTPIEAQEWAGKVRVFFRKHGWLPKDER